MTSFSCRSCGSNGHQPVLDLGLQPLANNLPLPSDLARPEPRFPLRVVVCSKCHLIQITDIVPPVDLFSEYLYFSSVSDALLRHSKQAVDRHLIEESLGPHSFVVEIASNDGYLLRNFVAERIPCLGIEPASNIARVANQQGIPTLNRFFSRDLAVELARDRRPADLILANNVFAHVPDINDFVAGLATLVAPNGRIVLEFPYACDLIEHLEFDTIYHEHVFYFTLTALAPLFARHGLQPFDVSRIPIHGGSLRLSVVPAGSRAPRPAIQQLLHEEHLKGVHLPHYCETFARNVHHLRDQLLALLHHLRSNRKRIAAYGASAKGSTLLNFYGIGRQGFDCLEFVADRSPAKQGRLTPGSHLPIVPPEQLLRDRPDYALLLTWNFADEILAQQQAYRDAGGQFIRPLPTVAIT